MTNRRAVRRVQSITWPLEEGAAHNKEIMTASSQISQTSVRAVRIELFTARVFRPVSYRTLD